MIVQRLIIEIRERKVLQTVIIYLGGFWGLLQALDFLFQKLHVESNLVSILLVVGLCIFPSILVFSWYRSSQGAFKKQLFFYASNGIVVALSLVYYPSQLDGNNSIEEEPNESAIAVLPFTDLSSEQDQQYFADGLSEELLNLLAHVPQLKVIGRASSFQFKGAKLDLREIGKKLNVSRILDGSIRKSGNSLRIKIELIDARDGSHIWSQSFDRTLSDIFAVQDEIAASVVEALKVTLTDPTTVQSKRIDPESYNLFFQGKYIYENDVEGTDKAIYWFKESIRLDSSFALPWTYLAMCYWRQALNANEVQFNEAKITAQRAVELDPKSAIAVINLGEILENEFDLQGEREKIELALKLDPNNPYVLRNAGRFYTVIGDPEKGIAFCNQALQNDPIQRTALMYLTRAYFYAGREKEAIATIRKYEGLGYKWFYFLYIKSLFKGINPEKELVDAQSLTDEKARLFHLSIANIKLGRKKEAYFNLNQLTEKYSGQYSYFIAFVYAFNGENEKALVWLEKSFNNRERWLLYMYVDPVFKPLQKNERFVKILQAMNFPKKTNG